MTQSPIVWSCMEEFAAPIAGDLRIFGSSTWKVSPSGGSFPLREHPQGREAVSWGGLSIPPEIVSSCLGAVPELFPIIMILGGLKYAETFRQGETAK